MSHNALHSKVCEWLHSDSSFISSDKKVYSLPVTDVMFVEDFEDREIII